MTFFFYQLPWAYLESVFKLDLSTYKNIWTRAGLNPAPATGLSVLMNPLYQMPQAYVHLPKGI